MISHDITAHNMLPMFATLYMLILTNMSNYYMHMYIIGITFHTHYILYVYYQGQASACVITSYICISYCRD